MQIAPGAIVGGKYRLEQPLSRGGMGAVWIARHMHLRAPVAIKFMDPALAGTPAYRTRFEREARAAARLQSPHVVHVQDYGLEDDTPYLVMELLDGESLGERLHRELRLSIPEVARILLQIGKGLRRAHEAGLVHRDLKPANLFLARVEDDEIVKILDFGIAKEIEPRHSGEVTRSGQVLGSPYYMSPEQVRGDKDLDHRSDLWSLGVIGFRMLTGQLPFPGEAMGEVLARILADPLPVPTQMAPDLPPEIDAFFTKALARDRAQRFQSVRELVDAFARIADVTAPSSDFRPMMPAAPLAPVEDLRAAAPIQGEATAPLPAGGTMPLPEVAYRPAAGGVLAQSVPVSAPSPQEAAPVDTPTISGVTGPSTTSRRRARLRWGLGLGAALLALTGAGVTAGRLRSLGVTGPGAAQRASGAADAPERSAPQAPPHILMDPSASTPDRAEPPGSSEADRPPRPALSASAGPALRPAPNTLRAASPAGRTAEQARPQAPSPAPTGRAPSKATPPAGKSWGF